MPWVLGHDMFIDDLKRFGARHRDITKLKPSKGWLKDITCLDIIYEDVLKQPYEVQYSVGRKGRSPLPVFYFYQVDDDDPPILEYGKNGCPTRDWFRRLRAAHGGRREMWYPANNWTEESRGSMPRKVVYAKRPKASTSLDRLVEVSVRERLSVLTIQEEDAEE